MKPHRIQLSRKKGWRMPPNTVKVDRTTKWGNPFIVGKHGTTEECVRRFKFLLAGYLCISSGFECADAQERLLAHAKRHIKSLRGKNLACWCQIGKSCHADVLLEIANSKE